MQGIQADCGQHVHGELFSHLLAVQHTSLMEILLEALGQVVKKHLVPYQPALCASPVYSDQTGHQTFLDHYSPTTNPPLPPLCTIPPPRHRRHKGGHLGQDLPDYAVMEATATVGEPPIELVNYSISFDNCLSDVTAAVSPTTIATLKGRHSCKHKR